MSRRAFRFCALKLWKRINRGILEDLSPLCQLWGFNYSKRAVFCGGNPWKSLKDCYNNWNRFEFSEEKQAFALKRAQYKWKCHLEDSCWESPLLYSKIRSREPHLGGAEILKGCETVPLITPGKVQNWRPFNLRAKGIFYLSTGDRTLQNTDVLCFVNSCRLLCIIITILDAITSYTCRHCFPST